MIEDVVKRCFKIKQAVAACNYHRDISRLINININVNTHPFNGAFPGLPR